MGLTHFNFLTLLTPFTLHLQYTVIPQAIRPRILVFVIAGKAPS